MAHQIGTEDGVILREIAWHRLGTVVGDNFTWLDAMSDDQPVTYGVQKVPVAAIAREGVRTQSDDFATLRSDGLVIATGLGEQYTVFPASEGYEFGQAIRGEAEESGISANLRSLGTLYNGRRWFMTFDLGEFSIGDHVIKDFLSVNGSYDSSWALQAISSPIVEVCANTVAFARESGVEHYKFKHTKGIYNRVAEAKRALGRHRQNRAAFQTLGEALLATPVPARTYGQLLDKLFPLPEGEPTTKVVNAREEAIEAVTMLYKGSGDLVGDTGNGWAVVQAVNTFENWAAPVRCTNGRGEAETRALRQVDTLVNGGQPLTNKTIALVGASN